MIYVLAMCSFFAHNPTMHCKPMFGVSYSSLEECQVERLLAAKRSNIPLYIEPKGDNLGYRFECLQKPTWSIAP